MHYILAKGFKSINGQVEIIDSDSLCYLVRDNRKAATGIRIISKSLLNEYIDYFEKYPNNSPLQAKEDLLGKTETDIHEYEYTDTLTTMAKMVLGEELSSEDKTLFHRCEEVVIEDAALNQFARKCFSFLYKLDSFAAFWPSTILATIKSGATFRTIKDKDNGIVFTGLFKADNTDEGQYFPESYEEDGRLWFLPSNWSRMEYAPGTTGRNALSIQCLKRFIERFYPGYYIEIAQDYYKLVRNESDLLKPYQSKKCRRVIYFGAPGTGKSHAIDKILQKEAPKRNIRTTFHPDTDYSSFVGCFKPTMRNGSIVYEFTAQAFINAYIAAWSDISKPFYLVIEEINRGNCAQIFGDIFQLLDRNQSGESSYSIKPDTDLQIYIGDKLNTIPNIPEEVRTGMEMKLPSNMFIYATMNTSDQSLFPIDSAFKRRWDWRYTAIRPGDNEHAIVVGDKRYSWTSFIRLVNEKIYDLTKSEDKQLGYWFIKPDENNNINWDLFVSKVVFYLWNDVIKDYANMEKYDSPFGKKFAFTTFFDEEGNPIEEQVIEFLDALKVDDVSIEIEDNAPYSDDDNGDEDGTSRDFTEYQINGTGRYKKKYLAKELVQRYVNAHQDMSAFDVVKEWKTLGDLVSHFIELQEEFDQRKDKSPRVATVKCNGETIYVSTNGWGGIKKMKELKTAVESKDWGLTITEYKE